MVKPTIMIVDDVAMNIQSLVSMLEADYQLKLATSGALCLSLLQDYELPDLILLDVVMPDMDGYQVCEAIKSNNKLRHIPIIFVTAKDDEGDEEKGLHLGAVDYITKPIHPAIALARIKTHITLKLQYDSLTELAEKDQLTGLYNRHYFYDISEKKIAFAKRHLIPLSILLIDIDFFKQVNDQYGHMIGDEVLVEVAKIFSNNARQEDIVCRFGGEEFVILLDHCDLYAAQDKAECLRRKIEQLIPAGIDISISIGVAQLNCDDPKEDITFLIGEADEALYKAKKGGRNTVVLSEVLLQ